MIACLRLPRKMLQLRSRTVHAHYTMAHYTISSEAHQVKCVSSWSVPLLWRQPLEGLYLWKRSLILPNICVVCLVRSEQQWTLSVWQWQTKPLIWSRPSHRLWVQDVRLRLSRVMENPQWLIGILTLVHGVCLWNEVLQYCCFFLFVSFLCCAYPCGSVTWSIKSNQIIKLNQINLLVQQFVTTISEFQLFCFCFPFHPSPFAR